MPDRDIIKQDSRMTALILRRLPGFMLAWLLLPAYSVHAISVSPDTLKSGMKAASLSVDCANENLSEHRLVCQDTLVDISQSYVAGKVASGVVNTGLDQMGKITGKAGLTTFSKATRGAMRALGPTGKVMTSWKFGRMVGTQLSDHVVAPRVDEYLQEKARKESDHIRQQTALLQADQAVASEHRRILMERGVDEANAYLDRQISAAKEPAEPVYDVQKEMERVERLRKLAEEMDEDEAIRLSMEREAQSEDTESHPAEIGLEEAENQLPMAGEEESDTEFYAGEEASEIGDLEPGPIEVDDLEIDPTNPDAVQGMERAIEIYMELFGIAVEQEDFEQADSYLGRIGELHPDSPVLMTGRQQLADARQARAERLAEIERQRLEEEAVRQAELERQRIANVIEEHWAAFGAALDEDDFDEAANALSRISELNPDAPGLIEGEQRLADLQSALVVQSAPVVMELAGEMVSIPGGTFQMGDLSGGGDSDEKPVHSVTVPAFEVGKYEVTFAQWDACVADGGCGGYTPDDEGWGRGNRPVIHVSWDDIQLFIAWLNDRTGGNFRLPTEAEWEYAARAGSTTKYSWGDAIGVNRANCDGCGSRWDDKQTAPVGSFASNDFGLYDMHGNVWEWVQDCWNDSYAGAPSDGSAWISGDCSLRVCRGGSWYNKPAYLRSASRGRLSRSNRSITLGFRLAQDM